MLHVYLNSKYGPTSANMFVSKNAEGQFLRAKLHTVILHKLQQFNVLLIWFINQRALYNHELSVMRHRRWHWCWQHWCLCTPPPGTGLDKETSYLVYMCTYIPHICTLNI